MKLGKKFLSELKERLEKEKKELEEELASFAKKDPELEGNYKTIFPDYGKTIGSQEENMDEVEEYVSKLPVEKTLEAKLQKVNEALARLKGKGFGTCENCKKAITKERLEVSPTAKICTECKGFV